MRCDTRGVKSESDRCTDGTVSNNFNRQRRDRSCKNSQRVGTRSQDGARRLQCSDAGDEADTRYGYAGSGLRTDASDPQYTGVKFWKKIKVKVTRGKVKSKRKK